MGGNCCKDITVAKTLGGILATASLIFSIFSLISIHDMDVYAADGDTKRMVFDGGKDKDDNEVPGKSLVLALSIVEIVMALHCWGLFQQCYSALTVEVSSSRTKEMIKSSNCITFLSNAIFLSGISVLTLIFQGKTGMPMVHDLILLALVVQPVLSVFAVMQMRS